MVDQVNKFQKPGRVKKVAASVLAPENAGLRIIPTFCGQDGKFESPLNKLLGKKWLRAREGYKEWFATQQNFKLGNMTTSAVASDIWVANLLVENKEGKVDDGAVKNSLKKLCDLSKYENATVHVSTMLTEAYPQLVKMLDEQLVVNGVSVFYYEEPKK